MEEVCRVCLAKSGSFINPFDERQKREICSADILAQVLGSVLGREHSLHEHVCPPCLEDALNTFNLMEYVDKVEPPCRDLVQEHIRTQPAEPRFKCPQCSSSFRRNSDLNVHTRRIHMGIKPFKCTHCTKAFDRPGVLQEHIRNHTGERPYKCSSCPKAFSHRGTFRRHNRRHPAEKPQTG
ncbi:zinc finger protein 273-like [Drosophila subobscura]|uniref:zinc finger protein 273-like n=1 Tax=Drosophila subobscura TaxID=7241 RepID=UPI00155ADBC2|nr:zinc finger protein 273-like [Drosophila subobscura]